ncbi:MAG: dockerin type I domain-containing protein, partial [bacterium]|nr:dockerin type I domain-containing protein [bacterium]
FSRLRSALWATMAMLTSLAGAHAQGWNVELVGWIGGAFTDVYVEGNYAYCTVSAGLLVMDVSVPSAPREVARLFLPGEALGVFVQGGYAYVADVRGGLLILRFTGLARYSVSGQVELQDFGGDLTQVPITIEIRQDGNVVRTETLTLDAQGGYTLSNLTPGTYDLAFKASHWLRRVVTVEVVSSDVLGVSVSLVNGDVDGDNDVSLLDFGELVAAFGSVPGDANWNAEADLDGDGDVSLMDFSVLVRNFGEVGEE